MSKERTFSIIKPDGVSRNLIGKIIFLEYLRGNNYFTIHSMKQSRDDSPGADQLPR